MNATQNIYDDQLFFNKYYISRNAANSYNNLVEQPAMSKLYIEDDLTGKSVLDLGCGYGANCKNFIEYGAKKVVGVDISEKMLQEAKSKNSHPNIEYISFDLNQICKINQVHNGFDLIYSSLAFHYVEDFKKLISSIYDLLNNNGILLFSIMHPVITANISYIGETPETSYLDPVVVKNYMNSGSRKFKWILNDVVFYHKPVSVIINTLIEVGFVITNITEPIPDANGINIAPFLAEELDRPSYLIVKATKN